MLLLNNLITYNNPYMVLFKDYYYDGEWNYYNEEENDYKEIGEYEDIYDDQWGDEIYDYDNDDYDENEDDDYPFFNYIDLRCFIFKIYCYILIGFLIYPIVLWIFLGLEWLLFI